MALALRTVILGVAAVLFSAITAAAQETRPERIENARVELSEIRSAIDSGADVDYIALEERLRAIRDASRARLGSIERERDSVQSQLDPLGAAPGENDPPESDFIANQRADLSASLTRLNGQYTAAQANIFEVADLLGRISANRLSSLYGQLLQREPSPLTPGVMSPAVRSSGEIFGRIAKYFTGWRQSKADADEGSLAIALIAGALVIAVIIFGPVNRWIAATFSRAIERRKPTHARRVLVAGLRVLARLIPGVIGGFIILETLRAQGVIQENGEAAAHAAWFGLLAILIVNGFTTGVLSPRNKNWRIAPVEEGNAARIRFLALGVTVVFSLGILLSAIADAALANDELSRVISASASLVIGVFYYLLARKNLWRNDDQSSEGAPARRPSTMWRIIRRTIRGTAIVMIISALVGYGALAHFLSSRIFYLALFLGAAWFVRALLMELSGWLYRRVDHRDFEDQDERDNASQNFAFWSGMIINFSLAVALAPAVLVLAGLPSTSVGDIARQAFLGFNIGGVQIPSIAKLVAAIAVFIAVMALSKLFQRGLQSGPFAHSDIDSGVQNSLTTLIGYAGLVVALFASVSTIGFDLGNLALIAGALSVGIGFGLQSIVNNFVSGLILLFERPIKVGDWIVTTSGEGTVKKISVRSTEIETFDRSSIIVPNSELISSSVTNWTHKDRMGRIIVPVGVSYGSDPEQVKAILMKCAEENEFIVSYPEPYIVWKDFGASSLDFELRAFLGDVSKSLQVRSELRFAIFAALAEAGVEIPFPQQDVYIKSMPDAFSAAAKSDIQENPDGDTVAT
ncbi:MAG: mechanosensitive ion channel [Marinicaulis sp.]|nr:mechanosensitive ion channel [Marinicaulis sp.]